MTVFVSFSDFKCQSKKDNTNAILRVTSGLNECHDISGHVPVTGSMFGLAWDKIGFCLKTIHFFLLFFASSAKLSVLHGSWKSASLEAICWMLVHKNFKPEGFWKMVKHVHRHFGTIMHSCLHTVQCRAILEIILAGSKWFLNLIWEKIFLGPNSFCYLRRRNQ